MGLQHVITAHVPDAQGRINFRHAYAIEGLWGETKNMVYRVYNQMP